MTVLIALILFGILQGLTEFLPVSSSGHLTLFQYFSKDLNEDLSLNIAVHIGTLLTILIFYRSDLSEIFRGCLKREREAVSMVMMVVVASIPTAVLGLLMKKKMGWILTHPVVAGSCLAITGVILFLSDRIRVSQSFQSGFGASYGRAFIIGLVQGMAVLPGISRSGSTIIAGLFLGMNPKNASRFSFLISVPAICGAALLEVMDLQEGIQWSSLLIGAVVSFLTGMLAIAWMVRLTLNGHLKAFSYYVFAISALFLTCYFSGWGQGIL